MFATQLFSMNTPTSAAQADVAACANPIKTTTTIKS